MKQELELLKKKYKKLKRYSIVLTTIIIIGFILALAALLLFLNRDLLRKVTIPQEMERYKNKIEQRFNPTYEYNEKVHNAAYKLNLGTEDLQGTHPKVLNFPTPWHGYKYYLVYSPYPYANDKYENPHLVASNDMIHWEVPKGLTNPIEPTPKNYLHEQVYNSDPHILYNPDKDIMELYWRFVDNINDKVIIYRKTSKDGITWSEKENIIEATRSKKDFLSPAFIYDNGVYKLWYVNKSLTISYLESKDLQHFTNSKEIKLEYPIPDLKTWHLDMIKTEKGYELITVAYRYHKDRNSMNLYYFNSKDNDKYSKGITILRPSLISWDSKGIYRSSFIYENNTYYVFYSGISKHNERGIGLSYGEHIENLIGSTIKDA